MNGNKQKKVMLRSLSLITCVFLILTSFFSTASLFSPDSDASAQGIETKERTGSGAITSLPYSFSFMESALKQMELAND